MAAADKAAKIEQTTKIGDQRRARQRKEAPIQPNPVK
jgi:hypothetical protein